MSRWWRWGGGVQAIYSLVEKLKIPMPGRPPTHPFELASLAMWVVEVNSRYVTPFRNLMASIHQASSVKKASSKMIGEPRAVVQRLVAKTRLRKSRPEATTKAA